VRRAGRVISRCRRVALNNNFTLVPLRLSARAQLLLLPVVAVATLGALCDPPAKSAEISRERAIEIARQEVNIDADTVEAVKVTSEGNAVWRVTFKGRLPDQPPGLFETRIVEIDARTGKIVSLSTS
jgi:hypothetical protein